MVEGNAKRKAPGHPNIIAMAGAEAAGASAAPSVGSTAARSERRARLSQSDVPGHSLLEALRIPGAIGDNYAFQPSRPLDVAAALGLQPTSGQFRSLAGAAIAYGLTDGGPNAELISVQPLARRILEPKEEGDDVLARREALLKPRVIREFLTKYDGSKLPRQDIAGNVLASMGVPRDSVQRTLNLIMEGAEETGLLREINGVSYINLQGSSVPSIPRPHVPDAVIETTVAPTSSSSGASASQRSVSSENRRVFVTHGSNRTFIEPVKELLTFGELEPIVSVEHESVSQPVPDKVMNDMRSCSAAIIHIDDERRLIDADGNQHVVLNPNVLIEVGAAIALYGRRFILLVKKGVTLPSNLQGLYEVRYDGDKLDGDTTIKLLKAIKDIKNHPLPGAED